MADQFIDRSTVLVPLLMVADVPDLVLERPAWHDQAECRGMGLSAFFIDRGAAGYPPEARAACARCPVAGPCLDTALAMSTAEDVGGMFAGTTPRERRVLRRSARAAA